MKEINFETMLMASFGLVCAVLGCAQKLHKHTRTQCRQTPVILTWWSCMGCAVAIRICMLTHCTIFFHGARPINIIFHWPPDSIERLQKRTERLENNTNWRRLMGQWNICATIASLVINFNDFPMENECWAHLLCRCCYVLIKLKSVTSWLQWTHGHSKQCSLTISTADHLFSDSQPFHNSDHLVRCIFSEDCS